MVARSFELNDINGGKISLNTIVPTMENGVWKGQYYTDYPITVTAKASPGYQFVGWDGDVTSTETVITTEILEGGIQLNAVFEKTK